MNVQSEEDFERAIREHPDLAEALQQVMAERDPRLAAIQALSAARSPQEVLHAARGHPFLFDDEGIEFIRQAIANARQQGEEGMARHLEERLNTLLDFRQSGMSLSDLAQMEQMTLALDAETAAALQELIQQGVDTPEKLEQALRARPDLREKLERATRQDAPGGPGDIPAELHPLLEEMARLKRLSDMPRKVELCQQALSLVRREDDPPLWAALQGELANALNQNPQGSRADNLERAIACYQNISQVYTREAFPTDWAMTQNNLATAYSERIRGERADNLEEAIRHYELALQVRTREAFPEQWATTQNNLANAYLNRIRGERADNLEEAIRHYELALQVYTIDLWADRAHTTARNLASAAEERSDWRAMHRALGLALLAAQQLFRDTISAVGTRSEAEKLAALGNRDILACLKFAGQDSTITRDILLDAEAARSRAFLRELGLGEFPPPPDVPADLVAQESRLRAQLREIIGSLSSIDALTDRATEVERTLVARRAALNREMKQTWEAMLQATSTVRDYVSLRRGDTPTWDDLQRLATRLGQEAVLVEFHNLEDRIVVIIWRAGWDAPRLVVAPLSQRELIQRYLLSYEREILNRYALKAAGRTPLNDWQKLGEVLLAPLEATLGDATLVYFIPHGVLHLIPLHALTVCGEPFIARRAVAYGPSAAALDRAASLANGGQPDKQGDHILVIGSTPFNFDREWIIGEALELGQLFNVPPLVDAAANRAALRERAPAASIIHLACHGRFNSDDALASAVQLADGEFTARDWMRLRLNADLVTLSACQLGISEQNPGDDLVGMARALMYAGASSLLLTLWSVRTDTTKDWMLDFYRRIWKTSNTGKSQPEAYAVRDATLALRAANSDPYVWAPFVLIGDWR